MRKRPAGIYVVCLCLIASGALLIWTASLLRGHPGALAIDYLTLQRGLGTWAAMLSVHLSSANGLIAQGVLFFVLAVGIWLLHRWARIATLVWLLFSIVFKLTTWAVLVRALGIERMGSPIGLGTIVSIGVFIYLLRPKVRALFVSTG